MIPNDAFEVYQDTIKRLEPDIHMIDAGAGWASIAISLKRIADSLELYGIHWQLEGGLISINEAKDLIANAKTRAR